MWLSTTSITSWWDGQRREVAVVDRGVGVLLRVEHPDHQVGELDQPVDLEVVGDLGGVVVGQVEQDDALQRAVLLAEVEQRVAHDLVARGDAEVVQQLVGTLLAPHAGGRPRRRRTAYADRGELDTRERVERRRLARAGRAGERDDGVVGGEAEPGRDACDGGLGRRRRRGRRDARGQPRRPARRPSIRSPSSEPRDTSLLAPSSKDVIFSLRTTPNARTGTSLVGVRPGRSGGGVAEVVDRACGVADAVGGGRVDAETDEQVG